jgi:hypothetical protein
MAEKQYKTLKEFYPFYLTEHQDGISRNLHFIGTTGVLFLFIGAFLTGDFTLLFWTPLLGYGFAWVGHFVFEKNRPATFQYPLYSFVSDFLMYRDILTGKITEKMEQAKKTIPPRAS